MARYTPAYSSFLRRLDEVHVLRRFAAAKELSDAVNLRHEINALCRGSIVLLSGHLEAFIKEVGELAADSLFNNNISRNDISPQFFYHISKNYINEIKDTSDHVKLAERIFAFCDEDKDYWSRQGAFPVQIPVDRFNKGFSTPAFKKVRKYFNRFGYSDYKKHLANSLRAQFQPTVNMVDHLVDTRNKIAHGDSSATKTPSEVENMISIIRVYCRVTDDVFAKWWKDNYCSIRR